MEPWPKPWQRPPAPQVTEENDEETHLERGRCTERWRSREGTPEGGRFGNRAGQKSWWFGLRTHAANRGPDALKHFYAKHGKRIPNSKAKSKPKGS